MSTSPSRASPGEAVNFTLVGLSQQSIDNMLIFGGRSPLACHYVDPPLVSTMLVMPDTSISIQGVFDNTPTTVECTLPTNVHPGKYRTVLHVAGQGWASAVLADTTVEVTPRIDSSPQVSSISLRGGIPLTFSTTGLIPSSITNTRVLIGNTPCIVQTITESGELTCLSQAAVDDGYSSLIQQSRPLAYWSLQADLSNGEVDGIVLFRNGGSIGRSADAVVAGTVLTGQEGISGNSVTDQAAYFESSYLVIPSEERLTRPADFAAEFWFKSDQNSDEYRIVFSSASYHNNIARGYIVLINPCNQLEFWVATEPEDQGSGSSGQGVGLGSGQSSGQGLFPEYDCGVILDVSVCSSSCTGSLTISEASTLPRGTWHVIRSELSDWSDWTYVYFGWEVEEEHNDCTVNNRCGGTQTLAINDDLTTTSTTFMHSLDTPIEVGGTSILPMGVPLGELTPFSGYLDEIAFYSKALSTEDIQNRVHFGSTEDQPIWLTVEGVNGIGTGVVPNVKYPEWNMAFTDEVSIDWNSVRDGSHVLGNSTALRFEWTG